MRIGPDAGKSSINGVGNPAADCCSFRSLIQRNGTTVQAITARCRRIERQILLGQESAQFIFKGLADSVTLSNVNAAQHQLINIHFDRRL